MQIFLEVHTQSRASNSYPERAVEYDIACWHPDSGWTPNTRYPGNAIGTDINAIQRNVFPSALYGTRMRLIIRVYHGGRPGLRWDLYGQRKHRNVHFFFGL